MPTWNHIHCIVSAKISQPIKKLTNTLLAFKPDSILSEDMRYRRYFLKEYLPQLYNQHTNKHYANCIFCANLVKASCHKYCFKCSAGTYIRCSPALPGAIYKEPLYPQEPGGQYIPWYYRKTCYHFRRLDPDKYRKNICSMLSPIGIYNMEILEGLEKGLCSGERPCHICSSVNYELYRDCLRQRGFNASSPCHKIKDKLKKVYEPL